MATIIELNDVSFSYDSQPTLEHISLVMKAGEYVGVIGPNGGGKTTLMKLMLGLLQPTAGTVQLWGTPLAQFREWSKIGYVPQRLGATEFRLPITVQEVVSFGALNRGHKTAATQAMEQVG